MKKRIGVLILILMVAFAGLLYSYDASFDTVRMVFKGSGDWTGQNQVLPIGTIGVESDTGKFKIGTGQAGWTGVPYADGMPLASIITSSVTLSVGDCGKTIDIATDALTVTLPTAPTVTSGQTNQACKLVFQNTGTAGNNIITIKSNGSAVFAGSCVTGAPSVVVISSATGSSLINTKATAKTGDKVELISAGSTTWLITNCVGTWASS